MASKIFLKSSISAPSPTIVSRGGHIEVHTRNVIIVQHRLEEVCNLPLGWCCKMQSPPESHQSLPADWKAFYWEQSASMWISPLPTFILEPVEPHCNRQLHKTISPTNFLALYAMIGNYWSFRQWNLFYCSSQTPFQALVSTKIIWWGAPSSPIESVRKTLKTPIPSIFVSFILHTKCAKGCSFIAGYEQQLYFKSAENLNVI